MRDWQTIVDACWPPERLVRAGPWTLRITPGGGGRVNAASGGGAEDIEEAEDAALVEGLRPSFVIWPGEEALDGALEARGYIVEDAVTLWTAEVAPLTAEPLPHATGFDVWPPLAIMRDIWAAGGHVGPARQAIMGRAAMPGGLFARVDDRAAGAGFVAAHEGTALVSAVEVLSRHRRKGVAGLLLRAAAHWAEARGCARIGLMAARDNAPANAAYASHGMEPAAGYRYRRHPEHPAP